MNQLRVNPVKVSNPDLFPAAHVKGTHMYNKVVLAVVQNVLNGVQRPINRNTNFKSLGASPQELNWVMFETERRLKVQLPETAITQESTIKDLLKTIVVNKRA